MKMALNSLSSCISIGRSFDSRVLRVIVSKHRIKEHHGYFGMKMTLPLVLVLAGHLIAGFRVPYCGWPTWDLAVRVKCS